MTTTYKKALSATTSTSLPWQISFLPSAFDFSSRWYVRNKLSRETIFFRFDIRLISLRHLFFRILENCITLLIPCDFVVFFQHEPSSLSRGFGLLFRFIYLTCVSPLLGSFFSSLSRWKIFTYFLYLKTFLLFSLINCFIKALLRVRVSLSASSEYIHFIKFWIRRNENVCRWEFSLEKE